MRNIFSKFLIALGILVLVSTASLYWQRYNPNRLKIDTQDIKFQNVQDTNPSRISIPEININLPVVVTSFNGEVWNTTSHGVSYIGNNIFYGHNWNSILGKLHKAEVGQKIVISITDGTSVNYSISEIKIVEPTNTNVLTLANQNTLVIYTCTGFFDTKRLVIIAEGE